MDYWFVGGLLFFCRIVFFFCGLLDFLVDYGFFVDYLFFYGLLFFLRNIVFLQDYWFSNGLSVFWWIIGLFVDC